MSNRRTPRAHSALIASLAAECKWAACPDRKAATEAARQAFNDRWEAIVDPDGRMAPDVRAKAAEAAKRAHYKRMALRSAQVRRAKAAGRAGKAVA